MRQAVFQWNSIMLIQESYYVTIAQSTESLIRYNLFQRCRKYVLLIIKILQIPIRLTFIRQIYDELGYLALPPCLWGPAEEGLIPPTFLSFDTNLMSIKRNNNTYTHYGEMASWQMRGILVKKDE